jgi:aryl-alcohol dehydrogenase-like predicted oxidoreductase
MEHHKPATTHDPGQDRTRRQFLRAAGWTGAAALGMSAGPGSDPLQTPVAGAQAADARAESDAISQRPLGGTGVRVSALGLGGHHLGELKKVEEAIRLVHEAIDSGISFFDNCWEYYNGRTEDWLGRALKGRRDKVFLMTKVCTHGRDSRLALRMLDESLRRLGTDRLDLWQVHGVSFDNDPEWAYARGGVLEALALAKREGKSRFVGFTGHKDPAIHLKMLQLGFAFDTVQMPLNPFDATFHSFETQVLPEVNRRGMAALGMKSLGGSADAVKRGVLTAEEALRYAMSLPVATTISGIDSRTVLQQNLRVARGFKPLSDEAMQALRNRCAPLAADGRFELYKVSLRYDNPQARWPHDFPLDPTQKEIKEMFKDVNAEETPH